MYSCEYFREDFLYVYDGPSMHSNLTRRLTGILPNNVTSTGSDIFIRFQSDYVIGKNGFKIRLKVVVKRFTRPFLSCTTPLSSRSSFNGPLRIRVPNVLKVAIGCETILKSGPKRSFRKLNFISD